MKTSAGLAVFFFAGVGCGYFDWTPGDFTLSNVSSIVLIGFLFVLGIGLGAHPRFRSVFGMAKTRFLLLPLGTVAGTLLGAGAMGLLAPEIGVRGSLTVGAGLGYYSLASVLAAQTAGEWIGVMTLLTNVVREVLTLLFAPVFVRRFGRFAPIAAGGATAMDTTLPVIVRCSGEDFAVAALSSGFVLSALVPFLVTLPFRM
jgi:uncharacterized membrane protein YbjE (DUF340 family)